MKKELYFTSLKEMESQSHDIIDFLGREKIRGIKTKEKEFKAGNWDNKYRIWIELMVAKSLFQNRCPIEILKGKAPDIKCNVNKYIEIKSFNREDFKEINLRTNLVNYLDKNLPQWKKLNFQIFINYRVGSQSRTNEQRKVNIILLDDKYIQKQLCKDVMIALEKELEKDQRPEFYTYKFNIVYFNNFINNSRKIFIDNDYSGDSESWLLNKIKILAEESERKFSVQDFNILFIYYPFIKRDFIDEIDWQAIQLSIWKNDDIQRVYKSIILSDFNKFFQTTQSRDNERIVKNLFK